MAFEGDLKNLELGDVLQTLAMTRQTGTLVVKNREERRLAFGDKGISLLSARPSHGERIATYLLGSGGIEAGAEARARKSIRRSATATLDEALEAIGACDAETMAAARRYVALEDIYEMFTWGEGAFEFLANEMDLSGRFSGFWFNIGIIAMEAARRIDELPGLEAQVASSELFVPCNAEFVLDPEEFSPNLCRLYPMVNGERTVSELEKAFHLGSFDTRKLLGSLLEKELIRPATVGELIVVTEHAFAQRAYPHAARLLTRAVEHEPENDDFREQLARALTESNRRRDAATCLAELGNRRHARGALDGARDAYESAVRLDASNADAHEGLATILFGEGNLEEGAAAARVAASNRLHTDDFEGAGRVAWMGLQHCENDAALRMSFANALLGLGDTDRAVAELDTVASLFQRAGDNDRKLLEVYRAIQRLVPERSDCARRIEQIQERERRRRKKTALRAIAAAVIVVCLAAAIPLLRGPTVQEEVDRARKLLNADQLEDALGILGKLRERELSEDELINVTGLQRDIARELEPRQIRPARKHLVSLVEPLYAEQSAGVERGDLTESLKLLDRALDILDGREANELAEISPEALTTLRRGCEREVSVALGHVAVRAIRISEDAARVESAFANSPAFRRARLTVNPEDLKDLQDLVEQAKQTRAASVGEDWAALGAIVERLAERIHEPGSNNVQRIRDALESLAETFPNVAEQGERALAHAHRSQLHTRYRDTQRRATELERSGQFEEALDMYRSYLDFCAEVRSAKQSDVYHEIVDGYLDSLPLEDLNEERALILENVLQREREAEAALDEGKFESAYRLRSALVRAHPAFGFETRLQLPLRLESRPSGAEVFVLNEAGARTLEGTTPLLLLYPVHSKTRIAIRMPGFEEHVIEREGATGDDAGHEVVELRKMSLWDWETRAATEATGVGWRDRVFFAGRDGVVRALSLQTGREIHSFETGLLGGISAAPAIEGDNLHVATVDGVGFVLDAETLTERHRYSLPGAVRANLVTVPGGVLVADETGIVRLVDGSGSSRWRQSVGKVITTPALSARGVLVCTVTGKLTLIDVSSGRVVWRVPLPGQTRWSAPLIHGSRAYVGDDSGALHCVDMATQEVVWSAAMGGPVSARPAVISGQIAVGTHRGRLHFVDPETGDIRATVSAGAAVSADLATIEGDLLVATDVGVVTRYDAKGVLVWSFDTGNTVGSPPTVHGTRVIAITRRGRAIAMER